MNSRRLLLLAPLCLPSLVGCGDDESAYADYVGIYRVESATRNEDGCQAEGPDAQAALLGEDRFLLATEQAFFFVPLLSVRACGSLEACREEAGESEPISFSSFNMAFGSEDGRSPETATASGGSAVDGVCDTTLAESVAERSGDRLVIRTKIREVSGFAVDSEGFCGIDEARAAAANQPCERLEVITARFVEALPESARP